MNDEYKISRPAGTIIMLATLAGVWLIHYLDPWWLQ